MDQIEVDAQAVKTGALGWLAANKWWLAACAGCLLLGLVL